MLTFVIRAYEMTPVGVVQMTAMVAGAREQLAGVREKAIADATVRELEMQARTASCLIGSPGVSFSLRRTSTVARGKGLCAAQNSRHGRAAGACTHP